MVKTEAQARDSWCPMVHIPGRVDDLVMAPVTAINSMDGHRDRGMYNEAPMAYCIGSRCMMWRWQETEFKKAPLPNGNAGGLQDVARGTERLGYCGLAGAPRVWP